MTISTADVHKTESLFLFNLAESAQKIGIITQDADLRSLEINRTPSVVIVQSPTRNESALRIEDIKKSFVIVGSSEEDLREKLKDLFVLAYLLRPEGGQPTLVHTLFDMTDTQNNGYPLVFSHVDFPLCDQEAKSEKLPFRFGSYLRENNIEVRDCEHALTSPTSDLTYYDPGFPARAQKIKELLKAA